MSCCCSKISVYNIFEGNVEETMIRPNESIQGGVAWNVIYEGCADAFAKYTSDKNKHWHVDIASIFTQIGAFVQRCKDVLEICIGQYNLTRKPNPRRQGKGTVIPIP